MPSQVAVNFFPVLKSEAEAIGPPYQPYPAPKLATAPCALPGAVFKRTVESDLARRATFGDGGRYPTSA